MGKGLIVFLSLCGGKVMPQGENAQFWPFKNKITMLAYSLLGRQIRYSRPPILIDSFDIDAYEKNVMPSPLNKP